MTRLLIILLAALSTFFATANKPDVYKSVDKKLDA